MNPTLLTLFCGLLLALSAFSIDIMLPAFENMRADLDTTMEKVQWSVPVFAVGFAFGQLVFGPVSDRIGRRATLIIGMALFFGGAVISAFAPGIEIVLAGRVLQGWGAGAAQVVARAILRDRNQGQALARAMALAMTIFAIGPIFAPLLGFGLTALSDWRMVFIAMMIFSIVLLSVTIFQFDETNQNIDPLALAPGKLWQSFSTVFVDRQSRSFLLIAIAAYCALLSFVANAPRIYATAFGVSGLSFAALFAVTGIGIIIGQQANRALLARLNILTIMRGAGLMLLLVSLTIAVVSAQGLLSAKIFTGLMFLFNTSFLVIISNASSLIIQPHQNIAGMASAILGFATLFGSGLYVIVTLAYFEGDIFIWSLGMCTATALAFGGLLVVHKKHLNF